MNEQQKTLIHYRRQKAKETLSEAEIMFANRKFFGCVNRLYYAAFYQVIALLLVKELFSVKHGGVMAMFNGHFVKTGLIETRMGKLYGRLFEFRQKADYGDFVKFDEQDIQQWLNDTREFLTVLDGLIDKFIK